MERFRLAVLPRLALAALLPLSACASYRPHPINPNASAARLLARNLEDPGLLRFIAAEEKSAKDPPRWNLATLSLVALYERPQMPIAKEGILFAQGKEIAAKELPNPKLLLQPTYNATNAFPSPWKVGPIVAFLVESWGARGARIARAKAEVGAAREALQRAAWGLRGQVAKALIAFWAARRRLSLAKSVLLVAERYEKALEVRFSAGMVSAASVNVARLAQSRAAIARASARRSLALAQSSLAFALGLPQKALSGVRLDLETLDHPRAPSKLSALTRQALTRRPDLLRALLRYKAAEAGLRLAIARQYPSLEIGPGYHYDEGDNKFILSLSLPLPILNQNQGAIASARAARALAADRFLAAQTGALGAIEHARSDWRASRAERESARRLESAAVDAQARARAAFKAGAIGRLRLLGAKTQLLQAKEGALAAAIHERTALAELERALYHPFL